MVWKLAKVKNKISEVNKKSYQKICGKKQTFHEFLLSGPGFEGVDLTRDKSPMRDISFEDSKDNYDKN